MLRRIHWLRPNYDTEPLGITLMRNVLAPTNALFFAHAHELTPLRGLIQAFVRLGPGAPRLVTRYYIEALRTFARAKPASFSQEESLGAKRLIDYAKASNLDIESLRHVLATRAMPRHHDKREVFFRLYLDRSIANRHLVVYLRTRCCDFNSGILGHNRA